MDTGHLYHACFVCAGSTTFGSDYLTRVGAGWAGSCSEHPPRCSAAFYPAALCLRQCQTDTSARANVRLHGASLPEAVAKIARVPAIGSSAASKNDTQSGSRMGE